MYASDNQSSESDSRSPKSGPIPTCVVAPSANQCRPDMECEDSNSSLPYIPSRKQREFIPDNRKDEGYWEKRRKNNEAARRSREKRRVHDMALENRIMDLTRDNCKLRNELLTLKKKFGLSPDEVISEGSDQPVSHNAAKMSPNRVNSHLSQPMLTQDIQACQPSPLHQSPPSRSKHPSGPLYPSHYLSFYQQQNAAANFTPSQLSADAIYRGRSAAQDLDVKHLFSGKFDAQSSLNTKSMPEEITVQQQRRIEDQLRPMYSSSLPPNQAPPYQLNPLAAVSSSKSYWVPTTDMTSSDSNDDSEWNDQVQDQPLSLVKKRPSTENESCSDNSSRASTSPPVSASSSALPHKLRHKLTHDYVTNSLSPYSNGLAHLSDIALSRQNFPSATSDDYHLENSLDSFRSRSRSHSNPRSMYDTKYIERRRKNNEAARKCRENRKSLTRIREVKSGYLENENNKLKDELCHLQDEMRELRELLEKKRQEKGIGSVSQMDHLGETEGEARREEGGARREGGTKHGDGWQLEEAELKEETVKTEAVEVADDEN